MKVVPETPVPDQVPPAVPVTKLLKLIEPAAAHIGDGLVHEAEPVGLPNEQFLNAGNKLAIKSITTLLFGLPFRAEFPAQFALRAKRLKSPVATKAP